MTAVGRKYPPGTPMSPSGHWVVAPCGRRVIRSRTAPPKTCTWCGVALTGRRTSWCSDACAARRWDFDPNTLRSRVLQRDAGKPCPLCGADRYFGEVDHTVPIIEGGEPWDLSNLRKICDACHKIETRALAGRRAQHRRESVSEAHT